MGGPRAYRVSFVGSSGTERGTLVGYIVVVHENWFAESGERARVGFRDSR